MSKKKRFGISEALTRGLTETISVVENNSSIYRNVVLPLSRIELDPENPRKLAINLADVREGIRPDDPRYEQKQEEHEKLKELGQTIKTSGLINPVVVYKKGELYRIVAGERRCLASIIAGKSDIEARVFNEKPKSFELKLIQWIENTAREDLTLNERLDNVRDLLEEYSIHHEVNEINATLLKNVMGLSLSQASYYVAALNAPEDVQAQIRNGNIRNLDKAALIAGIDSKDTRAEAIEACVNGSSLKTLRGIINQKNAQNRRHHQVNLQSAKSGRPSVKITMGSTHRVGVIKTIVDCVLSHQDYEKHIDLFSKVNWSDLREVNKAFRKLVELLEMEIVV